MQAKVPPNNLEAEASVLGAILIDPEVVVNVVEVLKPEHFYSPAHKTMFDGMLQLFEKRQPIDAVTLTNQLKKMKQLSAVGGAAAIAELTNTVSTSANALTYAQIVRECAIKRSIISLSGQLQEMAGDEGQEIGDMIDKAEQEVFALSQKHNQKSFAPIKDALAESFERLDELQKNSGELRGLPTGFLDLDGILAGLQKSNLIILAARPGMGKTALALNIAQHIAVTAKKKVGFFSLEMSKEELVDRLLVGQADIDAWRLKTGRLDQQDFLKLSEAMGVLAEAEIYIDDTPGLSIFDMRTRARRLASEHQVNMLVVDYLQLARGRTVDNRVQEVAEISQGLKNIARELKIPVLALSQLSRAVENRGGEKKPQLSDLRESGCVTADTLVTLADTGKRVRIADLVGKKNFKVWSLNLQTYALEKSLVSNAFPTGIKSVYELTTQLGRKIKATANHKFLTIKGWKRLDELAKDEYIALPREIYANYSPTMTDDELALLGHLIGDGCTLPSHAIQYTSKEKDLADLVATLATRVFKKDVKPRVQKERGWYQVYLASTRQHTHGVHSAVRDWLNKLGGWGLRSYEKYVPDKVFEQPLALIALFLKHLWSTDGCILMRRGRKPKPTVYYASSSSRLAHDVQSLLLRCGVNARFKRVLQKNKGRDQFHVIVTGQSDLRRFVDIIGAVGKYKSTELALINEYIYTTRGNTNRDIIPSSAWNLMIKPVMQSVKITQRHLCDELGGARSGAMFSQNLSRQRFLRIAMALESEKLQSLALSDVYWDRIQHVKHIGKEEVFDLTVPGNANFVANNIIIHNSIEQDADVVLFLYRKDEDIQEVVNLKIAKHRNGALGDIEMYFKGNRIKFYGVERKKEF